MRCPLAIANSAKPTIAEAYRSFRHSNALARESGNLRHAKGGIGAAEGRARASPIPIMDSAIAMSVTTSMGRRPILSDTAPANGAATAPRRGPIPRMMPIAAGRSPNARCSSIARNVMLIARATVTTPAPATRNMTPRGLRGFSSMGTTPGISCNFAAAGLWIALGAGGMVQSNQSSSRAKSTTRQGGPSVVKDRLSSSMATLRTARHRDELGAALRKLCAQYGLSHMTFRVASGRRAGLLRRHRLVLHGCAGHRRQEILGIANGSETEDLVIWLANALRGAELTAPLFCSPALEKTRTSRPSFNRQAPNSACGRLLASERPTWRGERNGRRTLGKTLA